MLGTDVDGAYRTIEALLVVHNYLERRLDDPTSIPEFNGRDEDDVEEVLHDAFGDMRVDGPDEQLHVMGVYRRKQLLNLFVHGDNHD